MPVRGRGAATPGVRLDFQVPATLRSGDRIEVSPETLEVRVNGAVVGYAQRTPVVWSPYLEWLREEAAWCGARVLMLWRDPFPVLDEAGIARWARFAAHFAGRALDEEAVLLLQEIAQPATLTEAAQRAADVEDARAWVAGRTCPDCGRYDGHLVRCPRRNANV